MGGGSSARLMKLMMRERVGKVFPLIFERNFVKIIVEDCICVHVLLLSNVLFLCLVRYTYFICSAHFEMD